jgi:hypothetical protein
MKNILIKISLILIGVVSLILVLSNAYMFFVMSKVTEAKGLFGKIEIVVKYKLFTNTGYCAYSSLLTVIILLVLFYFLIKEFVMKRNKEIVSRT